MAAGGSFIGWFVSLATAGALVVVAHWIRRPDHRPWREPADRRTPGAPWARVVTVVAVVAIVGTCAWCLRGLATPTVGFDAPRPVADAGGMVAAVAPAATHGHAPATEYCPCPDFLSPTGQCFNLPGLACHRQSLVATGSRDHRPAQYACSLSVAAFALVDAGRHFAHRLVSMDQRGGRTCCRAAWNARVTGFHWCHCWWVSSSPSCWSSSCSGSPSPS